MNNIMEFTKPKLLMYQIDIALIEYSESLKSNLVLVYILDPPPTQTPYPGQIFSQNPGMEGVGWACFFRSDDTFIDHLFCISS